MNRAIMLLMSGGWFITAVMAAVWKLDAVRAERMVKHYRNRWTEAATRGDA